MPPKKGKKMDLNAFLMDESTGGSWADEMDSLPTGPSGDPTLNVGALGGSHLSRGMGGDRGGYGGRSGGDFESDRPPRAELPIPTAPPYTAFVGNLSFDVLEDDLKDFFTGLSTTSIRLVQGHDMRPKGFGYVEFANVEDLKSALALTGQTVGSRPVRISVAEAPKTREGRADEEQTWTRSGPLAPLPGRSGGGGFDRDRNRTSDFGAPEVEREGPIRGGKFVPSAPSEPRSRFGGGFGGGDRSVSGPSGFGGSRDREFTPAPEVERDAPIRGGKFVPTAAPPERSERRTASGPSRADEEKTWSRGGALPPLAKTGGDFGSRGGFGDRGDRTPPQGEQPQRQRLQLSARSATPSTEVSPTGSPAPSSRPSPFGNAKPVSVAEKEREIEEKLAKEREAVQAKLAAEKEQREAQKKSASTKTDSSDRQKEVEEKIAKARAEAAVAKQSAPSPAPAAAPEVTPVAEKKAAVPASLRKEGFSYSSAANAKDDKSVSELAKKVEGTTV
ncbi:hypothetical protein T439DRAFT_347362 [Meredithblackwellia eburnea MCA 4105]